jgi:hypothetical protein
MVERNDAALLTGECSMEKPVSLVAIVFLATVSGGREPRGGARQDMFRVRMQAATQTVLTGLSWACVGFVLDLAGLILVLAGIIYVSRRPR